MKLRIIEAPFDDFSMGFYLVGTNIILINKRLDGYPKLKKLVIEHETKHFEEKTISKAIRRDYIDAPKIFKEDEFFRFYNDTIQRKNQELIVLKKGIYAFLVYPYLFITQIVFLMIHITKR